MSLNKGITALLVDDDVAIRKMIKTTLASMGVEVVAEGKDGKEGVELFMEFNPEITLLDIDMPMVDGITALKTIKSKSPDAKIIMLTSKTNLDNVKKCMEAGATDYIRKDTPLADIKRLLKEILARHG